MAKLTGKKTTFIVSLLFLAFLFYLWAFPTATFKAKGNDWVYLPEKTMTFPAIIKQNHKEYYVNEKKVKANGFQTFKGKTYYFYNWEGKRLHWFQVENQWYYFDPEDNGAMVTGFQKIGNGRYYFNEQGMMQTKSQKVKGTMVHFTDKGVITNWKEIQNGQK